MHFIHTARLVITLGLCPLVLAVKLRKNSTSFVRIKGKEGAFSTDIVQLPPKNLSSIVRRTCRIMSIVMIVGAVTYYHIIIYPLENAKSWRRL
jgi:hypothetical protein